MAWLLIVAPLEVATELAALVSRPAFSLGAAAIALLAARALVVAAGLMVGRQIARRVEGTRPVACLWASADLVTLAVVLATSALPTNRPPSDAPLVWALYALAALVVVAASD